MNRPYVQLDRSQWKQVHNSLCSAEQEVSQLFEVLRDGGRAMAAIEAIRQALAPAYAQDQTTFEQQWEYFRQVKIDNQFQAIWSIYDDVDVNGMDQPHPFTNARYVIYDNHWGERDGRVPIEGTTWLDLYRAADCAIRESGDTHHIYIEQFTPIQDTPGCLRLSTGS